MGRGSKDPWSTPSDTPRHTPLFGDTLSGTSRGTSGPKGPKTLVGGRVFLNVWAWCVSTVVGAISCFAAESVCQERSCPESKCA